MNELVSVVITTYKRPLAILKRAIESVVYQTYESMEIFVVNDNPEDLDLAEKIKELCQSYKNRKVQYIAPLKNSGACAARNLGLRHANGIFIAFLDDDDYWLRTKIENQRNGFDQKDIGVVYTPYYLEYKGKKRLIRSFQRSGNLTELLLYKNSMCIFPLMRTELVKQIGGFDSELQAGQEHDLLLRLSLKTKFKYMDIPTAVYDVSDESISMNMEKKIKGFERFMKKHKTLYQNYPKAYHYQLIHMVNNSNNAGNYYYAFRLWKKGLKYNLWSFQNISEPVKGVVKRIIGRKAFH